MHDEKLISFFSRRLLTIIQQRIKNKHENYKWIALFKKNIGR